MFSSCDHERDLWCVPYIEVLNLFSTGLKDIVIVIRSQHNAFHVKKAKALRQTLNEQAEALGEKVTAKILTYLKLIEIFLDKESCN